MKYKKIRRRRLTKFGKIFFSLITVLMIGIFSLCFINSKNKLYKKQETDNYSIEINYPNVKNENLLAYSTEYIKNKEEEFKNDISVQNRLLYRTIRVLLELFCGLGSQVL